MEGRTVTCLVSFSVHCIPKTDQTRIENWNVSETYLKTKTQMIEIDGICYFLLINSILGSDAVHISSKKCKILSNSWKIFCTLKKSSVELILCVEKIKNWDEWSFCSWVDRGWISIFWIFLTCYDIGLDKYSKFNILLQRNIRLIIVHTCRLL